MYKSEDLRSNQISSWLNGIILIEIVVELICGKEAKVRLLAFIREVTLIFFFSLRHHDFTQKLGE